jgi:hypothetical protein
MVRAVPGGSVIVGFFTVKIVFLRGSLWRDGR